ncbi:carbohydrate ABC transporter permease [Novibacillus thermophilus]|uniref:carbohydrate ABC transporter permease n=1 Tax=Novibacillus thermophilus TaxID=1471761 RepID=UPI00098A651C|nr:sugar ABC transporter permease [Novibacillus thermophilus]
MSVTTVDAQVTRGEPAEGWWSRYRLPLLFLLPSLVVTVCFFVAPVVITLIISMTDMSVSTGLSGFSWIGLEHYRSIADSPWVPVILKNTFLYVAGTLIFFNVGLGLVIAVATAFIPKPQGSVFRALWLLPRITPSVVYVIMMKWAAADAPYGILNQWLAPLGVEPQNWMYAQPWLFIIALNGFVGASMGMILFSSAIQSIPSTHFLAAEVDGASNWQIIRRIVLPQLKWPILFTTVYQTLSLLTSFEYIMLTTNGGPGFYTTEVWSLYAYHTALSNYYGNAQYGLGAALTAILVVIGIIMSVVYFKFFRFKELVARPKIEIN